MNSPNRRRFLRHLLIIVGAVGLVTLASGCVVPTPGPASKLPATYVAPVGLTIGPIQYGPDSVQLLDLYLPDPSQRPSPVIIYMHSGGWVGGERGVVSQAIQREVLRGYAVASIDYHISPQSVFPAALQDVKTAIRWAKVDGPNYALQPDEVFVAGSSAGGNLAAMAAVTPGQFEPTNLPASYAAVDSRPRGAITDVGRAEPLRHRSDAWLGSATSSTSTSAHSTRPPGYRRRRSTTWTRTSPPMYIAQGRWDSLCRPDRAAARWRCATHWSAGRGRLLRPGQEPGPQPRRRRHEHHGVRLLARRCPRRADRLTRHTLSRAARAPCRRVGRSAPRPPGTRPGAASAPGARAADRRPHSRVGVVGGARARARRTACPCGRARPAGRGSGRRSAPARLGRAASSGTRRRRTRRPVAQDLQHATGLALSRGCGTRGSRPWRRGYPREPMMHGP